MDGREQSIQEYARIESRWTPAQRATLQAARRVIISLLKLIEDLLTW